MKRSHGTGVCFERINDAKQILNLTEIEYEITEAIYHSYLPETCISTRSTEVLIDLCG